MSFFSPGGRLAGAAVTLLLASALLFAAGPARAATPTPTPTPRATVRATLRATATPRATVRATATPRATPTLRATATPRASATPAAGATPTAATLAAGLQAYKALGCSGCHSLSAAGATGSFGPSHEHVATTALERMADPLYDGEATTVQEFLRESIMNAELYVPAAFTLIKYRMPDYSFATEDQVEALVALLSQQK